MATLGEWILFFILIAYFGVHTLRHAWRTLNTDFPNYYLAAHLVHDAKDTSRIYEWVWLQRQKDNREMDQRIIALVPITAFSTLIVGPLTLFSPLVAKHWWLIANCGMLLGCVCLIRSLVKLSWRWTMLLAGIDFPLHRNFLYGQYYVLLLLLLTLACWLYMRQREFWAGVLVGFCAGLKVFPVIYFLYFLRRRDLKAFTGGVLGSSISVLAAVFVFGWQLHRTYYCKCYRGYFVAKGLILII